MPEVYVLVYAIYDKEKEVIGKKGSLHTNKFIFMNTIIIKKTTTT